MKDRTFDIIAGSIFAVAGTFFVVASRGLTTSSYGSAVGPDAFPTLLGSILVFLGGLSIIRNLKTGTPGKTVSAAPPGTTASGTDYKKLGALICFLAIYIGIFEPLGYVLSTFTFLLATFLLLEPKRPVRKALIAAVFSGTVYFLYVVLLQGTLPPFPEFFAGLAGSR